MKEFHSLLIETGLFEGLTAAEVEQVVQSADYIQLPTNWKIINQGEIGTEFFLVVTGSLQVFTTKPDGTEIALARLGRGNYVGEQALIPGRAKVRNASVRTAEPSSLLRIDKKYFEQALARDAQLVRRLELLGEKQVSDNLIKQSALFQTFQLGDASEWRREVYFSSQDVIFSEYQ